MLNEDLIVALEKAIEKGHNYFEVDSDSYDDDLRCFICSGTHYSEDHIPTIGTSNHEGAQVIIRFHEIFVNREKEFAAILIPRLNKFNKVIAIECTWSGL